MLTVCSSRSAGMSRQASTIAFTVSRRAASYPASPSAGVAARASQYASTRPSTIACEPPLAPTGYMGWAASPSRVTRPGPPEPCPREPHDGSGSLSTIGYSRIRGAPVIRPGTSSQPNFQSANHGSTSCTRPPRFQSAISSRSAKSLGNKASATQFTIARPLSSACREIG